MDSSNARTQQTLCVGVAGGTGSGKTTLVRRLVDLFQDDIAVIEQDAYYLDRRDVAAEDRQKINFDHPDAIEADLLIDHVLLLKNGQSVEGPVYDFISHTRSGSKTIYPAPIVIIEGILVLYWSRLRQLMDTSVFVDQDSAVRFQRRLIRDMAQRGRSAESVREQFDTQAQPMYDRFVEPCKGHAAWLIQGDESGEERFCELTDYLRQWLKSDRVSAGTNPDS